MKCVVIINLISLVLLKLSNSFPSERNLVLVYPLQYVHSEDSSRSAEKFAIFRSFATAEVTEDRSHHIIEKIPQYGAKSKPKRSNNRSKRYVLQGSRWRRKNLKYKISKYPKNLSPKDVDRAISRAFSAWSNVTNLTFAPSKGNADIEIKFETAKHNDEKPFDGAGGAFAHAFFPNHGGDVHFDASEGWTTNTKDGTDLFQVAVHELGHSLGLEHSNVKEALMAPFYGSYNPHFKLHEDDIRGIQALYGGKAKRQTARNCGGPGRRQYNRYDII